MMILCRLFLSASALCLMWPGVAFGMPTTPRLTFDVASIKPSQPGEVIYTIKPLPGGSGYTAQNAPVKLMIALMYKVPMRQINGGPDWINTDRFDVEARADHAYSVDDLHVMFQNLLADRFNLKFHKEIKEGPVYALSVDKSGLKMKADGTGQALGIPIVPATGGGFSGTLSFAPQLPPNVSRDSLPAEMQNLPSIFDALREQLGLRLEAKKGPVEYFVIDHVDKPSAN